MKILRISPSYYPATYWGGPIFCDYFLNNALTKLPEVSLRVLTTDTAGPLLTDRLNLEDTVGLYPNQEVYITRRIAGADVSIELLRMLPSLIRWADVVHLTAAYSFPTIPTLMICRTLHKPIVWSPHGAILDAYQWEGTRRKRLKQLWEKFCNALILPQMVITHTNSEAERRVTQERLPKATAVMIPHGVDIPNGIPSRHWLPNDQLRLMYLGRLAPKKGIENLLQAISRLNDPSITLTIYGAGDADYTDSLKSLADSLGLLGNTVSFVGHVDGESKSAAFYSADVCVVPSHTESFCMVVAESLAHGVPVIASKGTPWQAIEDNQCGLWVENDPESLAMAISRIRISDLKEMGGRGRAWMRNEFGWDAIARAVLETYKNIRVV